MTRPDTREDILSLAEDLEDGVQRNGSMDGEDGSVDLYDIDAANEVMGEAAKMLRTLAAAPTPPAAEAPGQEPVAVKPLEWTEKTRVPEKEWGPPILEHRHGHHSLGRYAGSYSIQQIEPGGPWGWWNTWTSDREPEGVEFSEEAAIAVCNADFAARIRSVLSAPPTYADAEAKGFERGVETAAKCLDSCIAAFHRKIACGEVDDVLADVLASITAVTANAAAIRSLASPAPKGET